MAVVCTCGRGRPPVRRRRSAGGRWDCWEGRGPGGRAPPHSAPLLAGRPRRARDRRATWWPSSSTAASPGPAPATLTQSKVFVVQQIPNSNLLLLVTDPTCDCSIFPPVLQEATEVKYILQSSGMCAAGAGL
ncbi:hypothetical protein H8959_014689 [Pygathrix nigripes]